MKTVTCNDQNHVGGALLLLYLESEQL